MAHETEYREWRETGDGKRVFAAARDLARGVKARGFLHFSAKALWERIRFDRTMELGPDAATGYKLNNNYTALLARELMETFSDLAGLFETRARISDGAGPAVVIACGRGAVDSPVDSPARRVQDMVRDAFRVATANESRRQSELF